jgi:hypothetical protein
MYSYEAYDAWIENLIKAKSSPNFRRPRPWRSAQESRMVRRFVFQWHTCRDNRPSGRAWARDLGVSHTWLQELVREFREDPTEVRQLQAYGDPKVGDLSRARENTRQMRERGELRLSRREKWSKFYERFPVAKPV